MDITFERATPEDAEKLLEIQKEAFQEALRLYEDYGTNPAFDSLQKITHRILSHHYYKVMADGTMVGGVHAEDKGEGRYYLHRIFIHPRYENLGIGKQAMTFIENLEACRNASVWMLDTPHKSYKNHAFYEKLGYVKTGEEKKISEKLTLLYYTKTVKRHEEG